MQSNRIWRVLICCLVCFVGVSCKKKTHNDPVYAFKVGLLVDAAGLNDKSFNQATLEGIQNGSRDIPFFYETQVGQTPEDYPKIIQDFIDRQFDLIIAPGYLVEDAMIEAAKLNPETDFLLLDVAPDTLTTNLACGVFDVDQASFPCGFLAAYWAFRQDHLQPIVGYVGGPNVQVIQQLSVSFEHGVTYFNNYYLRNVRCIGANTEDFVDSIRGAQLADSLIGAGAEVIFAFAGKAGNGALAQTKISGKWGIGMDSDQYFSFPEVQDILLTSCLKNLGNMVYLQLVNYYHDAFQGGEVIHGNLSNQGVGMAPYHEFEPMIPDTIKDAIGMILMGIEDGSIQTGW